MAKNTNTPAVTVEVEQDTTTPAPAKDGYVVQDGDTWASLGAKFGKGYATAVELMELNGGKGLVVGDTIQVK